LAIAIASFTQVANWFTTTSPVTLTASWAAGDVVVVAGGTESGNYTYGTPTATGLTFSLASTVAAGADECTAYIWTATAAGSGSGVTISATHSTGGNAGLAAWVCSGVSGVVASTGNFTETAYSLTTTAGDMVVYAGFDWNATTPNKTPSTGSGTATERTDTGNGSNYGIYIADWLGAAAGTFSFGPSNYTGLKVAQAAIRLTAAAGGATAPPPRRRPPYHLLAR
jgi:hypothetical protein